MTALITTSSSDQNDPGGGDIVLTKPSGTVAGDVLVAFMNNWISGGGSVPTLAGSGFSAAQSTTIDATETKIVSQYRVATGAEGASFTATLAASSSSRGVMLRIAGAAPTGLHASGNNTGNGATVTLPSVSAAGVNCLAIAYIVAGGNTVVTGTPTGWQRFPDPAANTLGFFWRIIESGQASGAGTIALGASVDWSAHVLLIPFDAATPSIVGIVSEIGTSMGAANAQPTFAAPAHPGAAGDLCIYLVGSDNTAGTAISASTGWTVLDHTVQGANVIAGAWVCRLLDGAHGTGDNTLSISGAAQDYAVLGIIIPAGSHGVANVSTDMPRGTPSSAASGNTDPPSDALASGTYAVLSAAVVDATTGNAITNWPSGYGIVGLATSANSTSSVMAGLAAKPVTGTSEDPGAWAHNTQENLGFTLAIPIAPSPFGRIQVRPSAAVQRAANW